MRTRKSYLISGFRPDITDFRTSLKYNHLKFSTVIMHMNCSIDYIYQQISLVISNDMITEVEDLLKEIAEKTGVRIE